MAPPTGQKCETCQYALRLGDGVGECHFDPPQVTLKRLAATAEDYYVTIWPTVNVGDWCGHWKQIT